MDAFVSENEVVAPVPSADELSASGKSSKTVHEAWEDKLCKCLKSSDLPAFKYAEGCVIVLEDDPASSLSDSSDDTALAKAEVSLETVTMTEPVAMPEAVLAASSEGGADPSGFSNSVIIASYKTDNKNDHTPEELQHEGKCIVRAYQDTHDSGLDLDGVTFLKESHYHKPHHDRMLLRGGRYHCNGAAMCSEY